MLVWGPKKKWEKGEKTTKNPTPPLKPKKKGSCGEKSQYQKRDPPGC